MKSEFIRGAFIIVFVAAILNGCTKNFEKINTPEGVLVADNLNKAQLGGAFAKSQWEGLFQERTTSQVIINLYADMYCQFFATTKPRSFTSDQFQERLFWNEYSWGELYANASPGLKFVEDFTAKNDMPLENAVAKIWRVEFYHQMTDLFGPIIYSQFGNGQTSVAYDSQESVYKDFFKTLDEAVAVLKSNPGKNAFGSNDLVYDGNTDNWLKLANSLRLRLAMRLVYRDAALAKQQAEKAVTDGVMDSNEDNASLKCNEAIYDSRNAYIAMNYIEEYRVSATMESILGGYNDPRQSVYFDKTHIGGEYRGVPNGLTITERQQMADDILYKTSYIGSKWINPTSTFHAGHTATEAPRYVFFTSAEANFLKAEGALRGWAMGGTAESFYKRGIMLSLTEVLSNISTSAIDAYVNSIATPKPITGLFNLPALTDIPVKYNSAGTFEKQLEQIITQKWISLYPNGLEGWAERRRTGYPKGYPLWNNNSLNPDIPSNDIPRRLSFSGAEYSTNTKAVEDAKTLLGGTDNMATKLWWDAR